MSSWQKVIILVFLGGAVFLVAAFPPHPKGALTPEAPAPSVSVASVVRGPSAMLFFGDVMLSRSVGALMAAKDDWLWPFRLTASVSAKADLTFANLETTISARGTKNGCGFCFRSDPRVVTGLIKEGFDVMSVANNHIWDYGPQAFSDTLGALSTADISPVGGGRNEAEARAGVVRDVNGTKVGFLAYTDILPASAYATADRAGVAPWTMNGMKEDIAAIKAKADIVVVSFHTGTEYQLAHNPNQEKIYKAAIDDGADLVIGTHPHVVQELVTYKNGWIAYSLGNFVFDQNFSAETRNGLAVSAVIKDNKISEVRSVRVSISKEYQPAFLSGR